jgi:hypothetical protein
MVCMRTPKVRRPIPAGIGQNRHLKKKGRATNRALIPPIPQNFPAGDSFAGIFCYTFGDRPLPVKPKVTNSSPLCSN